MHAHTPSLRTLLFCGLALSALAVPARAAEMYTVDPVHSSIIFRVKHLNVGYLYGRFNDCSGSFRFGPTPADCALDIQVKANSLDSNNAKRDEHLKGPDFFNVKQFPTISFKSTRVRPLDEKTYEVTGDLTLHGVSRPVTVKVERVGTAKGMRGETRSGIETATFTIKRSDYGMKYLAPAISDEVQIMVALEGTR